MSLKRVMVPRRGKTDNLTTTSGLTTQFTELRRSGIAWQRHGFSNEPIRISRVAALQLRNCRIFQLGNLADTLSESLRCYWATKDRRLCNAGGHLPQPQRAVPASREGQPSVW